jgi:thioesterase CepJ
MPVGLIDVNGVTLSYARYGAGPPVLLIAPAATRSWLWNLYQVPALCTAGYEVITFDHRGTEPSSVPDGPYRLADLVADTAGLIRGLGIGPCRVVGASLGALVAQELALVRPDLVAGLALLGTHGRMSHFLGALARGGIKLMLRPEDASPTHTAVVGMLQLFAPRTLTNDTFTGDWLQAALAFPVRGKGPAAQYGAIDIPDRLAALSAVAAPTLVMAFTHDLITPPDLTREVAKAIPGSRYLEVEHCGHFGFVERPDEVNRILIDFLEPVDGRVNLRP